jgi:hypothetical protein
VINVVSGTTAVGVGVAVRVSFGMTVGSAVGWVVGVVSGNRVSVGRGVTTSEGCVVGRTVISGVGVGREAFASVMFTAVLLSAEAMAALRRRSVSRIPMATEIRILDSCVLPLVRSLSSGITVLIQPSSLMHTVGAG